MNCQESVEILTTKIGTMKKNYMAGNFDQLYPLLENEPSEPVEEELSHRFYNRYPQIETIGLSLGHRVFHPVP